MQKPKPDQITIPDQRFSCTECGRCCRDWHVEVSPEEITRLETMAFPAEDAVPERTTTRIGGKNFVAHRENGACIFLNESNNRCRIHERHGYEAKPLGCKVYPYAITSTYEKRFAVTGRFDCPAIRANEGQPLSKDLPAVRGYLQHMQLGPGFDDLDLDKLEPKTSRRIVEVLHRDLLGAEDLDTPARLVAMLMAVDRLQVMGAIFLNETDLELILPSFVKRVKDDLAHQQLRRLSVFEKWRFLSLLSGYIRRDEELIGRGASSRLNRSLAIGKLFFGKVNLREFGGEHPDLVLRRDELFGSGIQNIQKVEFGCYEALVSVRLQAHQFMGKANFGLGFFDGLRSLFSTFPLVLAMAKCSAISRGKASLELTAEDVDYAVGAIDHGFGRSAVLGMAAMRSVTRQIAEPLPYIRLIHGLSASPT